MNSNSFLKDALGIQRNRIVEDLPEFGRPDMIEGPVPRVMKRGKAGGEQSPDMIQRRGRMKVSAMIQMRILGSANEGRAHLSRR